MNNLQTLTFMLILLFSFNLLFSQNMKYAIQTTNEEALRIHDDFLEKDYMIQSYIRSGAGCLVECQDSEKLFLENISNQNIKVKIFNINSQEQTTDFYLTAGSKQQISFLLKEYNVGSLHGSTSILNQITSFFSGKRAFEFGKNAILKNRNESLVFNHTDSLIIAEIEDYSLSWNTSVTLKRIAIYKNNFLPALWVDNDVRYKSIDISILHNDESEKLIFERGIHYTLEIILKEEVDKVYELQFYYISDNELAQLNSYLNSLEKEFNIILNGNFDH